MDLNKILADVPGKEEIIKQINSEIGKEFVPRSEFNDKNTELKALKEQVTERDTQLEQLKKSAGDSEELKSQIAKLQAENETAAQKTAQELLDLKRDYALKTALGNRVHDTDLVAGLIPKDKVIFNDDGTFTGLDEQIKALQETKGFLFRSEEKAPEQPQPQNPGFKFGSPKAEPQNPGDQIMAAFGLK